MIKQLEKISLPECLNVIRKSFSTVADEFGLTPENCPSHGAFMTLFSLQEELERGGTMFGLYDGTVLASFMQLCTLEGGNYELNKLSTLPAYRHKGYGKEMLVFAREKVKEWGGSKIIIGIIEDNVRLKEWYLKNGFIHTGAKTFEHLPFTVGFLEMNCHDEKK